MTSVRRVVGSLCVVAASLTAMGAPSSADEGGASFWIPGQYGSFIAVPDEPGWTLPILFYANKGNAGVEKRFTRGGVITTGLDGSGTLTLVSPTYTFRGTPLGGRASLGLGWGFGKMDVTSDATLTGPTGGVLERNVSDTYSGMSDLYPEGALRWNDGTSNYMLYVMGGVPIGAYSADRLASVGLGHGAIDGGGAFTYYDQPNGREVSAALGFTYNFENPNTHYQNGVDAHLDWAVSHFINEDTHAGVVGYFYDQLSGDHGDGAALGDFQTEATAVGGELGHFFDAGESKWYGQVKAYWDIYTKNRVKGWNLWLSASVPLGKKS